MNQTTPCVTVIQTRVSNLNPYSKASGNAIATAPELVRFKFVASVGDAFPVPRRFTRSLVGRSEQYL